MCCSREGPTGGGVRFLMSFDIAVVILSHAALWHASTPTRLPSHLLNRSVYLYTTKRNTSYQGYLQPKQIVHPSCYTNANAPQQPSSPPRQQTSPEAPSNPSTHTQNPSSHPSTRPQNHPPSTPTHPHTSTPARENATATTAPTLNPSTVRLLLFPGSAP